MARWRSRRWITSRTIPPEVLAEYRAARDPFGVTGSPALPHGLNFGAQLWWLAQQGLLEGATSLVPWAQYWAWFLSGVAVSEVTSLGCHSDLWEPAAGAFSPMARRLGWDAKFAPLVRAGDVVGTLRPELAAVTGLSPSVLRAGRAARFQRGAPCCARVCASGAWRGDGAFDRHLVCRDAAACEGWAGAAGGARLSGECRSGGPRGAFGAVHGRARDRADRRARLGSMRRTIRRRCWRRCRARAGGGHDAAADFGCRAAGRFPDLCGALDRRTFGQAIARRAAACLYAALVADAALDLIGARETLLVEGRFAAAEVFVRGAGGSCGPIRACW